MRMGKKKGELRKSLFTNHLTVRIKHVVIVLMKEIYTTYKFRLQPTNKQKVLLNKHFGCVRFLYNHFLNERQQQYKITGKSDGFNAQCLALTQLKKQPETQWLKETNSAALQYSLRNLDTAYARFFRGQSKFPKFKSKKNKHSFTCATPSAIKFKENKIFIPKFREGIKTIVHRKVVGEIRRMTLSLTPTSKYFVSILVKQQYTPRKPTGAIVGIDLGIKNFAITSDGKVYKNNRYTKRYARKLAKAQKHLSRKQKGSNSYHKQRIKVAQVHEKITNSRKDTLHKVSTQLINDYDLICLEDLNIKGMVKNHKLAKHIQDASWGTFIQFLEYKAERNDKAIVRINRFYPSSKTCNKCGWVKQDLSLSMRTWVCENCETKVDRDINAAKNILDEGYKIISARTVENTDGDDVSDTSCVLLSMKSEALVV